MRLKEIIIITVGDESDVGTWDPTSWSRGPNLSVQGGSVESVHCLSPQGR